MIPLTIEEIKSKIPHRYPFLLVDQVLKLEEGVSCTALKNLTINEPFFQGHFEDKPIMPGVLMIEALAQTAAISVKSSFLDKNSLFMFVGIDKVLFKAQAKPGDQLILKTRLLKKKMKIYFIDSQAYVRNVLGEESLCLSGLLKIMAVPK